MHANIWIFNNPFFLYIFIYARDGKSIAFVTRAFRNRERKIKKSVTEIEKTVKKRHAESVMKKGCLPTSPKKSQRIGFL